MRLWWNGRMTLSTNRTPLRGFRFEDVFMQQMDRRYAALVERPDDIVYK